MLAREGDGGATDNWDMNTLNETGPFAGQFLFRSHETLANGQVSVTDLQTGLTRVLVERADWNRMDGIVWTAVADAADRRRDAAGTAALDTGSAGATGASGPGL